MVVTPRELWFSFWGFVSTLTSSLYIMQSLENFLNILKIISNCSEKMKIKILQASAFALLSCS